MFILSKSFRNLLALAVVACLATVLGSGNASAAATITLSPTTGNPYSLVYVTGTQFISLDTIPAGGITFAGTPWNTEIIQIDNVGNWNTSLRIPASAALGSNSVQVSSTGGTTASANFVVTAPPVTLYPSSGPRYTLVTITGSNFTPLDSIQVGGMKFGGVTWNTAIIPIDGSGCWTTNLRVPANAVMGTNAVGIITAAGTVSSATFTVTAPPITLQPTSGSHYTPVTVSGLNFVPLDKIPVGGIKFGAILWNTSEIPIDGTGSWSASLRVPAGATVGANTVTVTTSGGSVATTSFTITVPPITLSPSSGNPYALVTVSGSKFGPLDTIAAGGITFAGASWNTESIQVDNSGNWNTSLRVPPNAVAGGNTVRVMTIGGATATATFSVTAPPITLSPNSGPRYSLVTISGSNFVPMDTIPLEGIRFDGSPWNTSAIPIDGSGHWSTTLRVPVTAVCCGSKPILVTTVAGTMATATFSVTAPPIALAPNSGPRYTLVTITGSNFVPLDTIPSGGIKFGSKPWNSAEIPIDGSGVWTASLRVPSDAANGANTVTVATNSGSVATATFTVTVPPVVLSPNSGPRYSMIAISGSNFVPQDKISEGSIKFSNIPWNTSEITVNNSGGWSTSLRVPTNANVGANTVSVTTTGGTVTTATFTVTVPPISLSPSTGTFYTLVTIRGSGFVPQETIPVGGITFSGVPWNTDLIHIDVCGDWNTSLRVPAHAVIGGNQVKVTTSGGTITTGTFTVTAPPISVSPSSGPPYTLVTITGSNFVPQDTIPVGGIKFDGAPWNTIAIPVDGFGRWSISLRVPLTATCCGGKSILVTSSGGTVSAATFSITAPVVTMTPTSGPIGTKVTICVTNMTPDGTIPVGGITFGGLPWNTSPVSIDFTGKVCSSILTVPTAAVGGHTVVINDGTIIATHNFTITQPTVSVSPATAYKGEKITISGSGWPLQMPGSVSVTFGGEVVGSVTPNDKGYFSTQFTVPLTANPITLIAASDVIGNTALPIRFSLRGPSFAVNPKNGPGGITATVGGVGFQPYSGVEELKFGNTNVLTGPLMTNETGAFATNFIVPGLPAGGYTVSVKIAGVALTDCFTITTSNALPPVPTEPEFPLEESLAGIADKIIIVWGYHNGEWKMYDPNDELGSTLDVLISGRGYWIKVTGNCLLFTRSLTTGWNLVGW